MRLEDYVFVCPDCGWQLDAAPDARAEVVDMQMAFAFAAADHFTAEHNDGQQRFLRPVELV